jgi:hypothetical protein
MLKILTEHIGVNIKGMQKNMALVCHGMDGAVIVGQKRKWLTE